MSVGATVRRWLGDQETVVSDAYRGLFVSLADLGQKIYKLRSEPLRILEVGCGEGAMTTLLSKLYPDAQITAIDISLTLGRQYRGEPDNVCFIREDISVLASDASLQPFDLVVMVDVMHHVNGDRMALLRHVHTVMAADGCFVLKDLDRGWHPVFLLAYAADYFITGDRQVRYHSKEELRVMMTDVFGEAAVSPCFHISPWVSNVGFSACLAVTR